MICLTAARYTMVATVRRGSVVNDQAAPDGATTIEPGRFIREQDPYTGDVSYVWEEVEIPGEDPAPVVNTRYYQIDCQAKAFTDTGYRSASNTEEFDKGIYRVYEYVELRYGPHINLSRRDIITSIRDKRTNKLLWAEEDAEVAQDGVFPATVFEVIGANPIIDPFGSHIENSTVLKRAAVQA